MLVLIIFLGGAFVIGNIAVNFAINELGREIENGD